MKLGIYGGTYNPIHNGHINAALSAANFIGLDKLLLIPTATPPHKQMPEDNPGSEARLEMLRLASKKDDRFAVSDMEIQRGGKSYTVDTLRILKQENPDAELFLLVGTDMLQSFERWYKADEILEMAVLAVCARGKSQNKEIYEFSESLRKKYQADVIIVENDVVEISSSEVRRLLKERCGNEYLDDSVYGYIIKNRFYSAKPSFEWLREKSYAMLNPKRIPHVKGCEEEAERLAKRWGADIEKAKEAAILHDCTKKLSAEQHLKLCSKYSIEIDEMERVSDKLLHSKTGAEIARDVFGVDKDVYSAILWHTTGREDMSLLEKVIYMADYIEPNRKFDGVDKLRKLAYENLDEAMILGFRMSLEDMQANGIIPHSRSVEALRYLENTLPK